MSEVVKPDFFEVILFDDPGEVLCHIVGANDFAALVNTDVVQIILAVGVFEEFAEHRLPLLLLKEKLFNCGDQRECAKAGFCF